MAFGLGRSPGPGPLAAPFPAGLSVAGPRGSDPTASLAGILLGPRPSQVWGDSTPGLGSHRLMSQEGVDSERGE